MTNPGSNTIELDISLSTVEVFDTLASQPLAILLDSSDASHENSRFDIMSIKPMCVLEAREGAFYLDGKCVKRDGFAIMQEKLAELKAISHPDLPFCGGWLGYFGYDLGRYIESIPQSAAQDIAIPDMVAGLYPDALIHDNHLNRWYFVTQPGYNRLSTYRSLIEQHRYEGDKFALTSHWQANMTQAEYAAKFARIHAYLKSGDCYQINLAQRFSAEYQGSPWCAYKTLRAKNQAPFSAFINLGEDAIVSVSPERFISVRHGQIETKPIKGTLPRLQDQQADAQQADTLQRSSKDRAENVMIVDLLRNDLGKVAKPGSVQVPKLFEIESFPAVHHLVSTVTAQLAEGKTAVDQLRAAFPGGSITGAPKIRAMEIIEELEPHRRSAYCGSIGYLSACGAMDTSITIRTLVCHQQKIHCWAGGGIVADSDCELEYQETYHKVNKILPIL
ncbi:aminodeoxychorismate synthase, component I [Pseudoalteromonas rubra]|uniref:aminodeoxychorismate synthase n=2 Tax=Pseudoalteromonas TaxID=53246 RepID=A0A5S3WFG5_9GAMM|nr:aminodeoxychorismate synthase component I [Pseudoalteromonas rubra]TMP24588.1 aminodeoxychorismate synthase, component I [Pseudoalteromonas rubra]TMP27956.1 aminodeoxychorismate synthase, component I [Pseudoalteromonas rubra]